MKAIQIDQTNPDLESAIQSLKVVQKPIPKPGPGQVLVKIEAAPCNPSDLLFLQGNYGKKKALPAVPGWEGAGTVVECGSGFIPWFLKGKRVACGGQSERDGTWAEYFIAEANSCLPLKDLVNFEQGSTLIINPLSAVGMVEIAQKEGRRAMIQNVAASQVGRMIQTLAKNKQIPLINIVRRQEQVEELLASGEKWVLNSEEKSFADQLKKIAKQLEATIAFDAVGGHMTGIILNAMPDKSKILVYGGLEGKFCEGISPLSLIFMRKTVEGFWLSEWLKTSGFFHVYKSSQLVQNLIVDGKFETKIRDTVGFDYWKSALLDYTRKMTTGKVILKPQK